MECHQLCLILFFSTLVVGISGKTTECRLSQLFVCGLDEACEQVGEGDNGICKCRPGFRRANSGGCDPVPTSTSSAKENEGQHEPYPPQPSSEKHEEPGSSGWSIALGTLIPIALIAGAVALVYSARRYKWHERMRRIGIRRYEEVFIGRTEEEDDDAPIA